MSKPPFSQIWSVIVGREGQTFTTKTGRPFTYEANSNGLVPDRTQYPISRSDFEAAYNLVPISGPGQINQLVRGPAYVWAILHDERISSGAW